MSERIIGVVTSTVVILSTDEITVVGRIPETMDAATANGFCAGQLRPRHGECSRD